jgi:multicomponent K+:H+ antiporter subunit D
MANAAMLGSLFFLAAIAMSGLPPLSGFIGKLMILDATRTSGAAGWIWTFVLATSLLVIIGFSRAGTMLFWKSEAVTGTLEPSPPARSASMVPAAILILGTALLSFSAGPVTRHLEATAQQLVTPRSYVDAVMDPSAHGQRTTEVR